MISTVIGWMFIVGGLLWALGAVARGGMTEYRATWGDIPADIFWSLPAVAIGVAIVWRS